MIEQLKKKIQWGVLKILRFEEKISDRWREGTNRRTIFALMFIGALSLYGYTQIIAPPRAFPVGVLVSVSEGATLAEAAAELKEQGVVENDVALRAIVYAMGRSTSVRAGDYLFSQPKNILAVARAITTGQFGLEPKRIRIPEGMTTAEMADVFSGALERVNRGQFIEKARPLEGYLYPDTYFFLPNANEDTIIRAMRQNFDARIETIMGNIVSSGKQIDAVVTMASLLEHEARTDEDRRKIAGVLWRRIAKNMPLQVDAAFLYSIGRTTFDLTTADLTDKDDPYNTYVHKGLPPGPIGNPSIEAIKAAATPIDNGNLFYLADRSGVTHYSKTYEEHLAKKRLYLGT